MFECALSIFIVHFWNMKTDILLIKAYQFVQGSFIDGKQIWLVLQNWFKTWLQDVQMKNYA